MSVCVCVCITLTTMCGCIFDLAWSTLNCAHHHHHHHHQQQQRHFSSISTARTNAAFLRPDSSLCPCRLSLLFLSDLSKNTQMSESNEEKEELTIRRLSIGLFDLTLHLLLCFFHSFSSLMSEIELNRHIRNRFHLRH